MTTAILWIDSQHMIAHTLCYRAEIGRLVICDEFIVTINALGRCQLSLDLRDGECGRTAANK